MVSVASESRRSSAPQNQNLRFGTWTPRTRASAVRPQTARSGKPGMRRPGTGVPRPTGASEARRPDTRPRSGRLSARPVNHVLHAPVEAVSLCQSENLHVLDLAGRGRCRPSEPERSRRHGARLGSAAMAQDRSPPAVRTSMACLNRNRPTPPLAATPAEKPGQLARWGQAGSPDLAAFPRGHSRSLKAEKGGRGPVQQARHPKATRGSQAAVRRLLQGGADEYCGWPNLGACALVP